MKQVLTDRLSNLLNNCIEEYIKYAVPVSSRVLQQRDDNSFSSATIRNDIKTLDHMGYLQQLFTSGGRVPTIMGYESYIKSSPNVTFVGDIVNDLYTLTCLVARIDRKLFGTGFVSQEMDAQMSALTARRQNIHRMLLDSDLDMSAFYLIIKERLNGRSKSEK